MTDSGQTVYVRAATRYHIPSGSNHSSSLCKPSSHVQQFTRSLTLSAVGAPAPDPPGRPLLQAARSGNGPVQIAPADNIAEEAGRPQQRQAPTCLCLPVPLRPAITNSEVSRQSDKAGNPPSSSPRPSAQIVRTHHLPSFAPPSRSPETGDPYPSFGPVGLFY